jgi:hypothetical protein
MRRIIYIIVGAVVLFSSFFITLWLTEPRSGIQRFAAERITNYSDLTNAAQNIGFRVSEGMKGNIDGLKRTNGPEVNMWGWLADPQGNSAPLSVLVFMDGLMVATAQTKGERLDVTDSLHLGFGADKNVAFSLNFNCRPGDQPVVVGVNEKNQYIPLKAQKCP